MIVHLTPNSRQNTRRRRSSSLLVHQPMARLSRTSRPLASQVDPVVVERAAEEARRQAEIEQELQLARDIQQGLLLEAVPRLPGWELTAVSLPARDLGGDLYDFLPLEDGLQGIMIGDVSGKGLPAALRMAVARTVFRFESRRGDTPGPTLAAVNRGVLTEIPQGMVTMLYAVLDPRAGSLRFANAGHTYPLLMNGAVNELELDGLPLGVDIDSDYGEITAQLDPGDSVLMYTDGVVEAAGPDEEYFSFDRLSTILDDCRSLKPRAMVSRLLSEMRAWSGSNLQSDDVTMVVLRRRLANMCEELYSIGVDSLGVEQAEELWTEFARQMPVALSEAGVDEWVELLSSQARPLQGRLGRGRARELLQQLRLAVEDYRIVGNNDSPGGSSP
jgi:sigma-B regulation protein RsbU (phosphoserine phosphatase)